MPQGAMDPQATAAMRAPVRVKIDRRGKIVDMSSPSLDALRKDVPGFDMSSFYSFSGTALPDKPVKTGDTWEQTLNLKLPLGIPGQAPTLTITGSNRYSLIGVVPQAGSRVASIRTTGNVRMPIGPLTFAPDPTHPERKVTLNINRMLVTMNGTQDLDLTKGRLGKTRSDVNASVAMSSEVPSGPNAPPMHFGFSVTGNFHMEVTPL
jgi:hypothetical protein